MAGLTARIGAGAGGRRAASPPSPRLATGPRRKARTAGPQTAIRAAGLVRSAARARMTTRTTSGSATWERAGRPGQPPQVPRRPGLRAAQVARKPGPRRTPRPTSGRPRQAQRASRTAAAAADPLPTQATTGSRCIRATSCRCLIRAVAGSLGRVQPTTDSRCIRPVICRCQIRAAPGSVRRVPANSGLRGTRRRTPVCGVTSRAADIRRLIRGRGATPMSATWRRTQLPHTRQPTMPTLLTGCRAIQSQVPGRSAGIETPIGPAGSGSCLAGRLAASPVPIRPFRQAGQVGRTGRTGRNGRNGLPGRPGPTVLTGPPGQALRTPLLRQARHRVSADRPGWHRPAGARGAASPPKAGRRSGRWIPAS